MYDPYRTAQRNHSNSEESRAVRTAPARLGYGSIRQMAASLQAGPEGLIDFAERLDILDDKARKLILRGYHFSEQGGAAIAEIGASPAKAKSFLARAKQLAEEKEADDYLSTKFRDWQTSLSNMLRQIEAGCRAIESEIGDVIKADVIAPFRDWWVTGLSRDHQQQPQGSRSRRHHGVCSRVRLRRCRPHARRPVATRRGFDIAGFATGIGEGIRAVYDTLHRLSTLFGGGPDGFSAETIGRVAAELLGLSLALRIIAPVVSVISAIKESLLALRAVAMLGGLAATTGALVPVTIAALAVGALAVSVINFGEIIDAMRDIWSSVTGAVAEVRFRRSAFDSTPGWRSVTTSTLSADGL